MQGIEELGVEVECKLVRLLDNQTCPLRCVFLVTNKEQPPLMQLQV
jgi:hypothetical protein